MMKKCGFNRIKNTMCTVQCRKRTEQFQISWKKIKISSIIRPSKKNDKQKKTTFLVSHYGEHIFEVLSFNWIVFEMCNQLNQPPRIHLLPTSIKFTAKQTNTPCGVSEEVATCHRTKVEADRIRSRVGVAGIWEFNSIQQRLSVIDMCSWVNEAQDLQCDNNT